MLIPQVTHKRCPRCGRTLPASAFAADRTQRDCLDPECKRCRQLRRREKSPLSKQLARFTDDDLQSELDRRAQLHQTPSA